MSKFMENQQAKQAQMQDRKSCKRELGKFCYDMAKITYTALVIGCFVPMMTGGDTLVFGVIVCIGVALTLVFAILGYKFNSFN